MNESPSRPGRVLIIDDEKRWRDILSHTLSEGGFMVATAATKEEASEQLATGFFHLVVLDIRMDLPDTSNEEGMELLREHEMLQDEAALAVIVLSAFSNEEQMREAFRDYRVTDFLKKHNFNDLEFLQQVRDLFESRLDINLNLVLHWQGGLDTHSAVDNLLIDGMRIKGKKEGAAGRLAEELEDLFCRLFHKAEQILLRPLGAGMSGTRVLLAQPTYRHGGAPPVVVKFGNVEVIETEHRNFTEYVQPYIVGRRATHVQSCRRTSRLGAIVYSLLGEAGGRIEDFAGFYRRSEAPDVLQTIDRLFESTCGAWYANLGQLGLVDLSQHYTEVMGIKPEALKRGLDDLKSVQGKDVLYFKSLPSQRNFPNPLAFLERSPVVVQTYRTTTHGDFNDQNILVDGEGHCWLIDFQSTGPGHILRDIVQLDAVIRVRLLAPGEASLEERLALEEALNAVGAFSQMTELAARPPAGNQAVLKAFAACAHLRALAARLVRSNPNPEVSEYYAGSLYCTLNMIRFRSLPVIQREHALLSASLLTERLRI